MMYAPQKKYHALSLASRLEAAGPHELVTVLYEELLKALDVMRVAAEQGKHEAVRSGQARAGSIILALQAGLDLDRGGELASRLSGVYRSMQRELALASGAQSSERFAGLRQGVAELLGAWVRIGVREAA